MCTALAKQSWYAVSVRSHHEKFVAAALRAKGYTEFLPLYTGYHRSGRRVVPVQLPLFPGYTFAFFEAGKRMPILTTPGVLSIVGSGSTPTPLDDSEIAAIQVVTRSAAAIEPWPYMQVGDAVIVVCGVLAGLTGLLTCSKGKHRIVLSVTLLQRSISVEIDDRWVKPVHHGSVPNLTSDTASGASLDAPAARFRLRARALINPATQEDLAGTGNPHSELPTR